MYGGQGKGEIFFNDLYSVKIVEQIGSKYVAIWQKINFVGTEIPYPRTSHTCISYKDRYLVVIGGETETVNKDTTTAAAGINSSVKFDIDVQLPPKED
jgi:hypothetical protein